MKVAQNDETIQDTQPIRPLHPPNLPNSQLSPSASSVQKRETPGILSRMFSPFTGTTSYHVRAHPTPLFALSCIVMHLLAMYLLLLPPLLSGRPCDDADAPVVDYVTDDPSLPEQPGKPPL